MASLVTLSPSAKPLGVSGSLKSRGNAIPDYVFAQLKLSGMTENVTLEKINKNLYNRKVTETLKRVQGDMKYEKEQEVCQTQ